MQTISAQLAQTNAVCFQPERRLPMNPGHLLSLSLSSIQNGGEGGRRPGEEVRRAQGLKVNTHGSQKSQPSACWPECVEESFERLMANIELIAELPLAASDFVRAAAGAL